jgi:hypothetical protein
MAVAEDVFEDALRAGSMCIACLQTQAIKAHVTWHIDVRCDETEEDLAPLRRVVTSCKCNRAPSRCGEGHRQLHPGLNSVGWAIPQTT